MSARAIGCVFVLSVVILQWSASARGAQPPPALDALLANAGEYVQLFTDRFSNVVAEERYVQEFSPPPRRQALDSTASLQDRPMERALTSDFLLIRTQASEDWVAFRDTFEVDGKPVRGREERLSKLLFEPSPTAVERAARVAEEGARFTFGGTTRTLNNPLIALGFLQPRYQSRFRFNLGKVDRAVGADAWIVNYEERTQPTILRSVRPGQPDRNLIARGRWWIDRETGRVLKTELKAEGDSIATSFRFDDGFQIAVPVEMRETFQLGAGRVNGVATYSRFRRFEVATDEKFQR